MHYIEFGATEWYDPSPTFDTAYYLEQCAALGIVADIPLLHFIEQGQALGLAPHRPTATEAAQERATVADDGISRGVRTAADAVGEIASSPLATPTNAGHPSAFARNEIRTWIELPTIIDGIATTDVASTLSIHGWSLAHNGVASVDIRVDDAPVGSAYYGIRRDDVANAFPGQPGALHSGFAASIPARDLTPGRSVVAVHVTDKAGNTADPIRFSIRIAAIGNESASGDFRRKLPPRALLLYDRLLEKKGRRPRFLLVVLSPSSEEERLALDRTLASVARQSYGDWELLIVTGTDDEKHALRHAASGFTESNGSISLLPLSKLPKTSKLTRADFCALLTPGDELEADALLEFAAWSACNPGRDILYCDERRIDPSTGRKSIFFKPDWSPDLLLSTNYIGRLWFCSTSLLKGIGWTLSDLISRGGYDIVLALTEHAREIGHVPAVLLDRRHETESDDADRAALEGALRRRSIAAAVKPGCVCGTFQLRHPAADRGMVSIIIPTCAARGLIKTCIATIKNVSDYRNVEIICVENIDAERDNWCQWLSGNVDKVISVDEPFNWSRFNNLGAAAAGGDFLIFLNDDIEVVSADWIDVLLGFAEREDVGVVGPLLLYPNRTVQHAGLFLTRNNIARHAFRYNAENDPGYFGLALTDRNVIGVTGACLMTRRAVFERLGGFDEAHSVINNDLDYCLRSWEAGLRNVYTAQAKLMHHELASRGSLSEAYGADAFERRWGDVFLRGDPYFHPRLSKLHDDFSIDDEPFRVVHPGPPILSAAGVRRVLIVKLDHIGDAVTAIPAIRHLRGLFPEAEFFVLGSRGTSAIWSLVCGIDEVMEFDFFHPRSELGPLPLTGADLDDLRARLGVYRFDLAVDLRKSPETRHILRLANARYLAGFGHASEFPWLDISVEWERDQKFWRKNSHVSDDLLSLAHAIEIACDERRRIAPPPRQADPWPAFVPDSFRRGPVVAVHPAAGTPTRQWRPGYYARLIDLLIADHGVHVVVVGGPGDAGIGGAVMDQVRRADRVICGIGRMELADLFHFLPRCALFVGNNSGPSHIAALLGVPTVAIHSGVVSPQEWGPCGPVSVAVRRDMVCSPCYITRVEDCPRGLACLEQLEVGEVLQACARMIE